MVTGQRASRAHSAPCMEANQRPVATTGTVQRMARKLRHAVMLLLTPMAGRPDGAVGG